MSQQKEAELMTAVLLYAMRCLVEGDQAALRSMNFGPKEMDALKQLNLADLYRIDSLRTHCLQVHLDRRVFWPLVEHLQGQRESEELQQQLIRADAPLEMMHRLFGMSSREYTRWRRLLTLAPSVGRPPELDEPTNHRLWYAWKALIDDQGEDEGCELTAEAYLSLYQATDIPLRAIWMLTQRWYQDGLPDEPSQGDTDLNDDGD